MIKIENFEMFNIDGAMRGMRFPMNSNEKGDTVNGVIGNNDMELARKLSSADHPSHRKFQRQIFVSMDITSSLFWWKEMETYKVGTTSNSESTMHTLHKFPITAERFSLDGGRGLPESFIEYLEGLRLEYLETKDKEVWRTLIQALPSSWNQKRHWTANLEVLSNIIETRSNHKLSEWRTFCDEMRAKAWPIRMCSEKL